MSKKHLAGILVATTALALTCVIRVIAAEGTAAAALTGVVSSQADGPMEGVLVGAKRTGACRGTRTIHRRCTLGTVRRKDRGRRR
jgi:hypothetical protein